jgi:hypothetical protein
MTSLTWFCQTSRRIAALPYAQATGSANPSSHPARCRRPIRHITGLVIRQFRRNDIGDVEVTAFIEVGPVRKDELSLAPYGTGRGYLLISDRRNEPNHRSRVR